MLSGTPLPADDYYGDYTQLDNGVGMLTSFTTEFHSMLSTLDEDECAIEREVSLATGEAAYGMMRSLIDELEAQCPKLKCHLYKFKNNFFGGQVTVTGLLTGADLAEQLSGNLSETRCTSQEPRSEPRETCFFAECRLHSSVKSSAA